MSSAGQYYDDNTPPVAPQPQMAPGALSQAYQGGYGVYPQGMGYLNPLAGLMTPQVANNLANVGANLTSNPQEISGALTQAQTARDAATQDKAAAITRAINVLQNMPNYDQQIAGAAMSAGFGAPSRTGFSEAFANANRGLQGALTGNREFDSQNAMQVAKLGLMKAGLPEEAAEATLGDIEKKFDLGAKFSQDAAMAQYRENLINARNNAALLNYQGRLATSGLGMGMGMNGLSGVQPNDFATKIAGIENATGNPAAQNPLSSAMGNGQFLTGTWLPLIKQVRPDLASKMSDDQLLALRADPQISQQMIVENAKRNAQLFDQVGLPSNMTTLALAHRFGPQTAVAMLHSPENTPIASLVGQDVLTANPTIARQTVGQYVDNLQKQVGDTPVSAENGNLSVQTTGDDYLKSLPPAASTTVKALAEGRMAFPTGYALTKPYWQSMLQAVSQYDPNFDAVNYNSRAATRKDFTSGKSAQNITSFNTAIGHLGALDQAIDGLNNTSMPWYNTLANTISTNMGDARYQKAAANFNAAKNAVVDELTRAFRGSGGNVHDIESWESAINTADSPASLHQAVQQAVQLLKSRIDSVGEQYNRGMGTTADPMTLLTPKAKETLQRIGGEQTASAAPNSTVARINSDAEYDKLPSGSYFVGPDGHTRRKP